MTSRPSSVLILGMLVVLAIGVALGGVYERDRASGPRIPKGAYLVVKADQEDVAANEEVLSGVPVFPGATFISSTVDQGPEGGRGATTRVYFSTPAADHGTIVAYFKGVLTGWRLGEQGAFPENSYAAFYRADTYLSVGANDVAIGGRRMVAGYSVAVNSQDANIMSSTG